jgi:hypothetical protein
MFRVRMNTQNKPSCTWGTCEASPGVCDITQCIHCGKELREKDGWWYAWDPDLHKGARQDPVDKTAQDEF